jgi:hypothetical protein
LRIASACGFWVCVVAERQPRNKSKSKLVLYAHGKEEYLHTHNINSVFFNTPFLWPPQAAKRKNGQFIMLEIRLTGVWIS